MAKYAAIMLMLVCAGCPKKAEPGYVVNIAYVSEGDIAWMREMDEIRKCHHINLMGGQTVYGEGDTVYKICPDCLEWVESQGE